MAASFRAVSRRLLFHLLVLIVIKRTFCPEENTHKDRISPSFGCFLMRNVPGNRLSHLNTRVDVRRRSRTPLLSSKSLLRQLRLLVVCTSLAVCVYITACIGTIALLLLLSGDIEVNPGPTYKFPCSRCDKPVKSNQDGLQCNECDCWFHRQCEFMSKNIYLALAHSDEEWLCTRCSLPNFSDSFFEPVSNIDSNHDSANEHNNNSNSQVCDLVDDDPSLTDVLEKFKQCCTLCHLNVRSLLGHLDELHAVFRSTVGKTVVFTLSETWLDPRIPDGVVSLPGYRIFRKDRSTVGGGVAVYCPDTLRCKRRLDLEVDCMEALWVEIFCKGKKPILLCTIYRPTNTDCSFTVNFSELMECATSEGKEVIVMGDFNIDQLNDRPSTRAFQTLLSEFSLSQIICEPTRITQSSRTLIDLILVSNQDAIAESGCLDVGGSDHHMHGLCCSRWYVKIGSHC